MEDRIGQRLGNYRLVRLLGKGGEVGGNALWTAIRHFTTNLRQDGKAADDPSVADRR